MVWGRRFLKYALNEDNVDKYVSFGVNVFDIDKKLPKMEIANKAIEMLSSFFFNTMGLQSTFTEVGIKREDFPIMAKKACEDATLEGFVDLTAEDIEKIYQMCL